MAHSRNVPASMVMELAATLALANIPFTMTHPGVDREVQFEAEYPSTLDLAIARVYERQTRQPGAGRLRVALDPETPGVDSCRMPQGHPFRCGCGLY